MTAGEDLVPGTQCDEREDFTRRAVADRRAILERRDPIAQLVVLRRDPADANPGEAERLRHHAQTHGAVVECRRWRKDRAPVMLQHPINFVAEEPNSALGTELDDHVEL